MSESQKHLLIVDDEQALREAIAERLADHGVRMERLDGPREVEVTLHRLSAVKLATTPFEGRVAVTATVSAMARRGLAVSSASAACRNARTVPAPAAGD